MTFDVALASLPRDEEGHLDGFSIVGAYDRVAEWVARRDDPWSDLPARPRTSYPDPVTCFCGAVFCPLRRQTKYCSVRCRARDAYWRDLERSRAYQREASRRHREKHRAESNRAARDRRRERRDTDPEFRAREAEYARRYRARKKAERDR